MIVDFMNAKELGRALVRRRKALGMTQAELADLAECSKPSVVAAEAGKPTLRLSILLALADTLGLELTLQPIRRDGA
ncbi:MAG: helix-turn-helix domain-containing protein [Fimbriimonadaceae bacterium]|nr:helix-turn-helix domain-containing protein [Fimbriimonadaceae bacterium]